MTNDYKDNILDYITNNITPTTGTNAPQFDTSTTINLDLLTTINNRLGTLEGAVTTSVVNCIVEETSQIIVFYGVYKVDVDEDASYGFIYITDRDLNEIQTITRFSSGSKMFPLRCLNQDETGQFYGITYDDTAYSTSNNARVLLFNNLFAQTSTGTYQVILRQSYFIPNRDNYIFATSYLPFNHQTKKAILKAPEEATYFIKCEEISTGDSYVIRFTINVGSENEWVFTNLGIMSNFYDMLIDKDNDKIRYHIYSQYQTGYTEQVVEDDTVTVAKSFDVGYYSLQQICAISTEEIYGIAVDYGFSTNVVKITNKLEPIYTVNDTDDTSMSLITENGILFLQVKTFSGFDPYQTQVGIVFNGTAYLANAETWTGGYTFFAVSSYNLVNIYVDTNDTAVKYILDFNILNYNGVSYVDYNQTLATKAELYSSGEMVFARNLYNTTLLGNIATSNLQVPNTLLNGIPIVIESLLGATNGVLINNSTPITKNIYETLYVNFIRSISVLDEDTNTSYPNTASYINKNINTASQQNCSNTFIGKVQINYSNNTIIQNINWTYDTDHYETSFVIDATNEVPTIDFLSNDETTLYITKTLDINTGSLYLIKQKLRIE